MRTIKINLHNPEKIFLEMAADIIKDGGVVIYPTDTAYGIGADILNRKAVDKLNLAKSRHPEKQYTAIVSDVKMAEKFCVLGDSEKRLIKKFMPGPLTLVLSKKDIVPDFIQKTDFAFRIPDCEIAREICSISGKAITASSANISGEETPYSVDEINPILKENVDLILDAGKLEKKKTSTICRVDEGKVRILRAGAIAEKDIVDAVGD
ncbi:MAG: threonylcarbamoyl-AMP synthase [Candidatus Aenigmarchaeota archaeon]|nr:threonylcarbamoyl-AMP synthase [Candidatus Aenigmarchaeota archaeon]